MDVQLFSWRSVSFLYLFFSSASVLSLPSLPQLSDGIVVEDRVSFISLVLRKVSLMVRPLAKVDLSPMAIRRFVP